MMGRAKLGNGGQGTTRLVGGAQPVARQLLRKYSHDRLCSCSLERVKMSGEETVPRSKNGVPVSSLEHTSMRRFIAS